jgi:hypothetical protein
MKGCIVMNALTYNEIVHNVNSEVLTETVKIQKLDTMFDMVLMKEYNLCTEARYKVYSEGGDSSDLEYLYSEAKAATAPEKKGILTRLWDTIMGIIEKITGFIGGIFGIKGVDNETIPVEKKYSDIKLLEIIQRGLDNIPRPIKTASALTAAGLSIGALGFEVKAYLDKFNGSDKDPISVKIGKTIIEKIKGLIDKISNFIKDLRKVQDDPNIEVKPEDTKEEKKDNGGAPEAKGNDDGKITDPAKISELVSKRETRIKNLESELANIKEEKKKQAKITEINSIKEEIKIIKSGNASKTAFTESVALLIGGSMYTEADQSILDKAKAAVGKTKDAIIRGILVGLSKIVQFFQAGVNMYANLIAKAAEKVKNGAGNAVDAAKGAVNNIRGKFRKGETADDAEENTTESAYWDFDFNSL